MARCRGEPLVKDQWPVFERCEESLGDGGDTGWKALESTSEEVEMSMHYFPPKKRKRSVATGKAVGVVDCSVEEVAAWVINFCSNEWMRMNEEGGNPATLELREKARVNEGTFATVKKMPFFLDNREFVFRMIWRSEEGKVLIAIESVDDKIDYGAKLKKTRAFMRGMYVLEDLPVRGGVEQCRVAFVQKIDAGGFLPTWLVDKKVLKSLAIVQQAIEEFRQVGLESRATEIEEPVEECAWFFTGVGFLLTSLCSLLFLLYGVTLKEQYLLMSFLV
ncbi:hypothetical protein TL16_g11144 [Triparma laevis f. inornata]|uniref:START domain-containing protein n=1 Tax=Triparma laevis f. inornata TaxID=1714386 RepID=A0A9W7BIB2_9STRA|nr:hypothetical protein TL16_g11144 [Triparma laevis f. inornata]